MGVAPTRSALLTPSLLAALVLVVLPMGTPGVRPVDQDGPDVRVAARDRSVQEGFVANRGQSDPRARYIFQAPTGSIWFTDDGLRIGLEDQQGTTQRWNLGLSFVGAASTRPEGLGRTPAVVSYFTGEPDRWVTGASTYSGLVYPDLWPGIDLVYRTTDRGLKSSFVVRPGADPATIRLAWRGATAVRPEGDGRRVISPAGSLTEAAPRSYQGSAGRRVWIPTSYRGSGLRYGFDLGPYDQDRPLVVDPPLILYAGYVGGGGDDSGRAVAVDGAGSAYVAGVTSSSAATFPASVGPDLTYNGGTDAFVAKVRADGTGLVYAGYIGGSGSDSATGIAVDGAGNAYVAGLTDSSASTFPATVGPDLTYGGGTDAFVAKVGPDGTTLAYAGYVGGGWWDAAAGIDVDAAGNAYVAGDTFSFDSFPVTTGPDLTFNGGVDGFVAKVKSSGTGFDYAGYVGGSFSEAARGIAVDAAGAAYLVGDTNSTALPGSGGPDDVYNGGVSDGFVAKVAATGSGFAFAGYIGGSGQDTATAVATDATGAAYLTGYTDSTAASFPVLVGPSLTPGGSIDAFVAKVAPTGVLGYAGYIGGGALDAGRAIAVDGIGAAYVSGETASSEATFPASGGPDLTYGGGTDGFVAKVEPLGTGLILAGYLGGSASDAATGMALDAGGNAYVAGQTASSAATFPATVGPDLTAGGALDAFVAKVGEGPEPSPSPGPSGVPTTSPAAAVVSCLGHPATLIGTEGPDVLTGTGGRDVIAGLGGNDLLDGLGGADRLCGGDGKDRMKGSTGKDRLDGGSGRDRCNGGPGRDRAPRCERLKQVP